MMAWVNPSLQVVKSYQVIALHSSRLGDIVDLGSRVSSRPIIPFADKAVDKFPASVDYISDMVTEHVFG